MSLPRTAYSGTLVFDVSPVCASGWIFDVYPEPGGMALWLVGDMGENHKFHVPFAPSLQMLFNAPSTLVGKPSTKESY